MEDLSEVKHITLGDLPVSEITLGDTVVWQRSAWEPETQDILDYADLNGYTKPSYRYIVELNFFIWNLKRFELWDEVHDLIYWMEGDGDLNFKCINLVNTSVSGTPNGGLINELKGIKGNLVDGWVNTGYDPTVSGNKYILNDAHRSAYAYYEGTGTTSTRMIDSGFGGGISGYNFMRLRLGSASGGAATINSIQSSGEGGSIPDVGDFQGVGLKSIVRIDDSTIKGFSGQETIATSYGDETLRSATQYLFRLTNTYSDVGLSFYGLGASINYPQHQLLGWATEGKLTAIRNQETVDLIKYAVANDIKLPSIENLYQTDRRIHNLKKWGLWTNIFDVLYLLDGDGEANFRALNIVNPAMSGTPYGGLILTPDGIEGNGVDGYIDTNFNPSLLISGQKYQLNDASRGTIVTKEYTSLSNPVIDGTVGSVGNNTYFNSSGVQRINNGIFNGFVADLRGLGLKVITRLSNTIVRAFNNDITTEGIQSSTGLINANQSLLRSGNGTGTTYYGTIRTSSYFMGKSVTLPQTQIFTHILSGDIEKIHNAETKAVIEYAMDMGYKLPTLPYLLKLDQFIQDVKERGLWSKFDVLYAMRGDVGECAEFRCINLVNPDLSGTPMGGLILTDLGIEGNAVDGYIDSGFNPNVGINKYTIHDAHRTAYVYNVSGTSTNTNTIDSAGGDTINTMIIANVGSQRINSGGFNLNAAADLSNVGFKSIVRVNGTDVELVNNDILLNRTTTGNQLTGNNQHIFRGRNVFSPNGLSTYSMGSAITYEESQLLKQAILKYVS